MSEPYATDYIERLRPDPAGERWDLGDGLVIARDRGDVTLPNDRYLSGRHAALLRSAGRVVLRDLESKNGTFVRVRGELELRPGDQLLIGGQLFRFDV